ncbi:MAG: DUF3343 domain-containing protein [Synergistaceae bacterium]|nr:DUF3343 domain-containing protein [Synergistaceae bacterium]
MECLATFDTTHMALFFEKSCRSAGLDVRIIPVPRQLSASCGLACSYPCDKEEMVRAIVLKKGIEVTDYHRL